MLWSNSLVTRCCRCSFGKIFSPMFYRKSREFPGFLGGISMVSGRRSLFFGFSHLQIPSGITPPAVSIAASDSILAPFWHIFLHQGRLGSKGCHKLQIPSRFPAEFLVDSSCRSRGNKNEKIEQSSKPGVLPLCILVLMDCAIPQDIG